MNGLRSIKLEYTLLGDAANRKSRVNLSVDTEGALSCDPHEAQHATWADHTAASSMHNMNSPQFDFEPNGGITCLALLMCSVNE